LGFRIAIDDLGAEQADPSTFNQLEPEFVKLDISMIRNVGKDPAKRRLVQSMVRLCHNLGKSVIAEGVENAEQHSALVDSGCDFLQGFYLGRPGPLDSLRPALASGAA
jgi:EAL domain-containing protein (putative c-di-GMP-specific phosphodiesterase class I)